MKKKVVAFLPVKGTSSRIENKNIKLLDGKPLFLHTLEKLMKCNFIDEVYLDTESENIIDIASETGCKIFKRDPTLANNKTDGHKLFINEVNSTEADVYLQILCTSPFIEISTIKNAIDKVISEEYDSAVLMNSQKLYTWNQEKPNYDINNIPNSIDLEDTIIETMGLYVMSKEAAKKTQRRIGEKPAMVYASAIESIDVNFPDEFNLANFIAAGKREADRKLYNNIKQHLTSSALSDIMDDLEIDSVITKFKPNIRESKIFGRAKTLKLRKLKKGEEFKGIYEALKSYDTIIPGDIIIVENEEPDFAYFGELNANLAIRSGVDGVIIGGKTRDSLEVLKLGLTVFSNGTAARDVRKRCTIENYNKKINFEGIEVNCGDLIFADNDGIIIIPQKYEEIVIEKIFEVISKEKNILLDIATGVNGIDLYNKYGGF